MAILQRIPLALVAIIVGGILTVVGIAAYFLDYATLNLAGFFYGIPLFLGGLAFRVTEVKPVPIVTPATPEIEALRPTQATATQQQILQSVTIYRYGQKAHMDETLAHLGLSPIEKQRPSLVGIREGIVDNAYALVLMFESDFVPYAEWQKRETKMNAFFGPGVRVAMANPEEGYVQLSIISTPEEAATVAVS
jgi:Protein of unknown function (DUF2854)